MRQIIINGKFMADRMQGIVRYSRELLSALDIILEDDCDIILAVPSNARDIPKYQHIKTITIGHKKGILWEQTDFAQYLRKNKDSIPINFCNVAPIFVQAGITTIHDIMYKVNREDYKTIRNRVSRLWHVFQYKYICGKEKIILTDSMYSKKEIEKYYPKAKNKIEIIGCGWEHVKKYNENKKWEENYPELKKNQYYFSLSTLARNKNGKWIIDAAKNNPEEVFAIAGKYYETEAFEIPENVHFLGFISDEDACSLIKNCKAFIYPSLYEGFGLPPLEALALGANVVSSDATSLPEVLGDDVVYINPNNANVCIASLLNNNKSDGKTLNRHSWENSAKKLLTIIKENS